MRLRDWAILLIFALAAACAPQDGGRSILNVSYDATREFYAAFNEEFVRSWREASGETILVNMSHGGSGKQARAVRDGLEADVVTLAVGADIDLIARDTGLVSLQWREKLPSGAAPYYSTIVFVVRDGNPKGVQDWDDLLESGVQVIVPNPKTSGGARWGYLAAWAWAKGASGGDEAAAQRRLVELFSNVPLLETSARGAVTTFAQRGIGDVLVTWESEARLVVHEFRSQHLQIVHPSISIRAEPTVAQVVGHSDRHGVSDVAQAYLSALFLSTGQRLAVRYGLRPAFPELVDPVALADFPSVEMVTIDDATFNGWDSAQDRHFSEGGTFDQVIAARK
jgi:sulfate transport system substrate-binding protein